MKKRCDRCLSDPLYITYHDQERGVPVHDDRKHFEFLILEGAQAGLSRLTVLKKRENYRVAFDDFDPKKVAHYDEKKIEELMKNTGIIRNKLKISSTITNAKKFLELQKEYGSFDSYIRSFTNNKIIVNRPASLKDYQPRSELSDIVSADLKKRGFKFVGSTIIYAHLQAIGIINDHMQHCNTATKDNSLVGYISHLISPFSRGCP